VLRASKTRVTALLERAPEEEIYAHQLRLEGFALFRIIEAWIIVSARLGGLDVQCRKHPVPIEGHNGHAAGRAKATFVTRFDKLPS
jgi:hypothetical protein